ncbi:DUF5301 domain-containing protein [Cytobacillus firmus]|uniref:DUF5301 domain-containing protein n=1 Tax=Cytobacillus firmus DS1 TaxID=1307436 RepID=W7KR58_CYTFI|nr:DUF5301 domain-containing protein [Cytobacillus firmus]EWG08608.1 hypothetical protein PBF_23483 [Cytobacillus firmus DS1]
MKKTIIFSLVLVLGIFGFIYFYTLKSSSLEEIVLFNVEEITSIEIKKNSEEIILTDKNEIEKIMDDFSKIELRKNEQSDKGFNESYWISLFENNKQTYGLTFYDNNFINIYSFETRESSQFKVINENKLEIQNLFK